MTFEFESKRTFNDITNSITELASKIINEFDSNYKKQKGRELEEQEIFAIAFVSGVNIHTELGEHNMLKIVTDKCSVAWNGEKFLVATMKE